MTVILATSARKQGGKGTLCAFLARNAGVLFGRGPAVPTAKVYSMAGPLKRFCHEVLGLTHEQCWGTDADKNSLTRYRWEDLPHYPYVLERVRAEVEELYDRVDGTFPWWDRLIDRVLRLRPLVVEKWADIRAPKGLMTARQVLQEVGTGIFRRMWADVWNQACVAAIRRDNPDVALIDDVRFPDEAEAVKAAGGLVFRLTRAPFKAADEHASETAMDAYERFDGWVRNHELDARQSCRALVALLRDKLLISEAAATSPALVGPDGGPLWDPGYQGPSQHDGGFFEDGVEYPPTSGVQVREGLDD